MGCETSRFDTSIEEVAFKEGQGQLKYSQYRIKRMAKILASVSVQGMITKESFKNLANEFSLPCASKVKISKFYTIIQEKEAYSLQVLTTLVVLLCKGSIEEKASVLFKTWAKFSKFITREEFDKMLDCLFDLALEKLTVLKKEPENGPLKKEDLKKYLNTAKKGREISKRTILNELFSSDKLEKNYFSLWLNQGDNSQWTIPSNIRQNLFLVGKTIQKMSFSNFDRVKNHTFKASKDDSIERIENSQ